MSSAAFVILCFLPDRLSDWVIRNPNMVLICISLMAIEVENILFVVYGSFVDILLCLILWPIFKLVFSFS